MSRTTATGARDVPRGVRLRQTFEVRGAVASVAFHPEGRLLASGDFGGELNLWEMESGRVTRLPRIDTSSISGVAFDSQTGALACASREGAKVEIWEGTDFKTRRTIETNLDNAFAFAFDRGLLALADTPTVQLLKASTGRALHTLQNRKGKSSPIMSVAFDPAVTTLASGGWDYKVSIWKISNGQLLHSLEGDQSAIWGLAFHPQGGILASGSLDGLVKLWDVRNGKLLRTLEGHTNFIDQVAFSPDGMLFASKSSDLRLWDCRTWKTVAVIPEFTNLQRRVPALAFHPTLPLLANAASRPNATPDTQSQLINIWELDYDVLFGRRSRASTVGTSAPLRQVHSTDGHYRNAKVVLVGNTSVGKSGLGLVLAGRKFRATESSHGRHIWTMDTASESSSKAAVSAAKQKTKPILNETRETLLWDLAGQPGYRLVHQLHLGEVAVALVLFDARSETEPFAGVSYWARALDSARNETFPLKKFLVASRIDRNGPAVSQARINEIVKRYGFDGYYETSAKRGDGVEKLQAALIKAIAWNDIPAITRSAEFQITKAFLVESKRRGKIVEETELLFKELTKSASRKQTAERTRLTREIFDACLQQLETTGLIRRLSFGDWVLLQPELLDDYCGWLTQAARAEPDGLGFIWEEDALAGRFPMDKDRPLGKGLKKEEQTLLLAAVEESMSRGLAIRETAAKQRRTLLVFPAELREDLPDYPGGYSLAVRFRFHGPVRGIFASLVVRLLYSMEFDKEVLHRNAALFRAAHDGGRICGLAVDYPDVEDDSLGRITVFFDDNTRAASKSLFLKYVNSQLKEMAFDGTDIERERVYHCASCDLTIEPKAIEVARKLKRNSVNCSACGTPIPLDDLVEHSQQADARLQEIDRQAETGQRLAGLATTIEERQKDGNFDVFLCHNSRDKPAVRELAKDLRDMGLLAWMDEERLLPGDVVQEKLEHAIQQAGAVIVCIGPSGLGRWQSVEYHTVYERFIELSDSEANVGFRPSARLRVIPVVLPGAETNQIPSFLRRHLYVDLRKKSGGTRREFMQKLVTTILGGES